MALLRHDCITGTLLPHQPALTLCLSFGKTAQRPAAVLVHDKGDAGAGQDPDRVGCHALVKAAETLVSPGQSQAGGYIWVNVRSSMVLVREERKEG